MPPDRDEEPGHEPATHELDDESLVGRYRELDRARRALDAEAAALLAELNRRDIPDRTFGHRTRAWVALDTGAPGRQASRDLRVAKLLDSCPDLSRALRDGEISVHHVDTIARCTNPRNVDSVIAIQNELIALVGAFTRFESWERQVRDLLAAADEDGGHDPSPEQNHLSVVEGLDGDVHVKGTFVGQWARTVKDTLERLADRQFRIFDRDSDSTDGELPVPARSTLMALAFAEACRNGVAAAAGAKNPAADVSLIIHSDEPTVTISREGSAVDHRTASIFRCDPVIYPVVMNSLGIPTDVGRASRLVTAAQRRALAARDGGCVFPGCEASASWTDAHHVIPWEHGGTTDLANLANLCRHHHGVVHRKGWSMRHTGDQRFVITMPSGREVACQRHGRVCEALAS